MGKPPAWEMCGLFFGFACGVKSGFVMVSHIRGGFSRGFFGGASQGFNGACALPRTQAASLAFETMHCAWWVAFHLVEGNCRLVVVKYRPRLGRCSRRTWYGLADPYQLDLSSRPPVDFAVAQFFNNTH